MSFGSTAYQSYVRIQTEAGHRRFPSWSGLTHESRLAWEAAAQAVAMAVLPSSQYCDAFDDEDTEEENDDEDGHDQLESELSSQCDVESVR